MAITDLTNLYTPAVWGAAMAEHLPNVSRLMQSGAIDSNSEYGQYINGPGNIYTIPIIKPLAGRSQTLSANNTPQAGAVSSIVPKSNTTGLMQVVRHQRGDGWSWKDLATQIAGLENALGVVGRGFSPREGAEIKGDPLALLEQMLIEYWAADMQYTLVQMLKGIFANTTMAAEHRIDNSLATAGTPTAINKISVSAILAGKALLGDNQQKLSTIVMHTMQYSVLQNLNMIQYLKLDQNIEVPVIAGMRVIQDDGVNVVPAAGGIPAKYSCYMLGANSIAYQARTEDTPIEVARDAAAGVDTLYNRMGFILQPKGISWTGALAAGEFPTDAQLAVGTNYSRVLAAKNVPIVELVLN